jgi:hypothetical protein
MGTIHGLRASSQARAICAGVAPPRDRDPRHEVDHGLVRRHGLSGESRHDAADVPRGELLVGRHGSGEEPPAQRGSLPRSEVGIFVAFAHLRTSDGSSVTELPSSLKLVHVDAAVSDFEPGQVRAASCWKGKWHDHQDRDHASDCTDVAGAGFEPATSGL